MCVTSRDGFSYVFGLFEGRRSMMLPDGTEARTADAMNVADLVTMLRMSADVLTQHEDLLTSLDQAIGDGDHGRNMRIGFRAVLDDLESARDNDRDLGRLLSYVGLTLISSVGGASGPLYGAAFTAAGMVLSGRDCASLEELSAALEAACRGLARRGHCYPGDKTILDTLQPAADALKTALAGGSSFESALAQMREAAHQGMVSTIPLQARCGLAMRYGPASIGHQDPGATSCYLLLDALVSAWQSHRA
jgi:dihydroxyacetone kinase-like protein